MHVNMNAFITVECVFIDVVIIISVQRFSYKRMSKNKAFLRLDYILFFAKKISNVRDNSGLISDIFCEKILSLYSMGAFFCL